MPDIFGRALLDYQTGNYKEDIVTYSTIGGRDVLPLPYLFRTYADMPGLEKKALDLCKGAILDIGCGGGSHALYLQERGLDVTGLDKSPGAIKTCKLRGLKKTMIGTPGAIYGTKFDTIILLMNGIGLAETMANLSHFLFQLKALLNPNGQVLLDSSDIIYMYDHEEAPVQEAYYGEASFVTEYKGIKSDPFDWLYIDFDMLRKTAEKNGWHCELVMEGEHYDYLARLTVK
ncbi:MAG: class I SAM-dependent methyltransferase [Flavobacteriaceae bacterium]